MNDAGFSLIQFMPFVLRFPAIQRFVDFKKQPTDLES